MSCDVGCRHGSDLVGLAVAGGSSSDWAPGLGTSMCHGSGPIKTKDKRQKQNKTKPLKNRPQIFLLLQKLFNSQGTNQYIEESSSCSLPQSGLTHGWNSVSLCVLFRPGLAPRRQDVSRCWPLLPDVLNHSVFVTLLTSASTSVQGELWRQKCRSRKCSC